MSGVAPLPPAPELGQRLIDRVSAVVHEITGVQLGQRQRSMVEARISRRMIDLGMVDPRTYERYLEAHLAGETAVLVSLLTTHHTFFFREFEHFEFLREHGLSRIAAALKALGKRHLRVWTMACSRGQETYSLAMFLLQHWPQHMPGGTFEIYATDVDPESVAIAKNGVYRFDEIKSAPAAYIRGCWARGTGDIANFVRAKDVLRQVCRFDVGNLMAISSPKAGEFYDLVFCRNVFIYFTPVQIREVTVRIMALLSAHAYFVIGTTESLSGLKLPITSLGTSVYQLAPKPDVVAVQVANQVPGSSASTKTTIGSVATMAPSRSLIRVLAVDDSPTILAILKSILTKDAGFEIVGTAANGEEALQLASRLVFDVMALDIHMPVKSGVDYLQQRRVLGHPPIVMLSSISREETTLGVKTLELGAVDYVEKPTLGNMAERGDELKMKLRCAVAANPAGTAVASAQGASGLSRTSELKSQVQESVGGSRALMDPNGGLLPMEPALPASTEKTRVLIVDDSKTIRQVLRSIFARDPDIEVVGECENPLEVEKLIARLRPTVLSLDVNMPEMDGVTLVRLLVPKLRLPIVMVTSLSMEQGDQVMQALAAGAVDYIQKPSLSEIDASATEICQRFRAASRAKVRVDPATIIPIRRRIQASGIRPIILIGSSTGGIEAVREILREMPANIPPIIIVQHIPAQFSKAFAASLAATMPFEVKEAADGDDVKDGRVLVAPGGYQMDLKETTSGVKVRVFSGAAVSGHRPSVDVLFRSGAQVLGAAAVGVILTGMGKDGADGLLRMRESGASTLGQSEATCVVYGMPGAAKRIGAVEVELPIQDIAQRLIDLTDQWSTRRTKGLRKG